MKNAETSLANNFRDDGKKVVSFLVHCFIVTALSFRITLWENSLTKFEKREFIFSDVFAAVAVVIVVAQAPYFGEHGGWKRPEPVSWSLFQDPPKASCLGSDSELCNTENITNTVNSITLERTL